MCVGYKNLKKAISLYVPMMRVGCVGCVGYFIQYARACTRAHAPDKLRPAGMSFTSYTSYTEPLYTLVNNLRRAV